MSKVSRYIGRAMIKTYHPETGDPFGDWVQSDDYDALLQQRDELLAMLERYATTDDKYGDPDNAAMNEVWSAALTLIARIKATQWER